MPSEFAEFVGNKAPRTGICHHGLGDDIDGAAGVWVSTWLMTVPHVMNVFSRMLWLGGGVHGQHQTPGLGGAGGGPAWTTANGTLQSNPRPTMEIPAPRAECAFCNGANAKQGARISASPGCMARMAMVRICHRQTRALADQAQRHSRRNYHPTPLPKIVALGTMGSNFLSR